MTTQIIGTVHPGIGASMPMTDPAPLRKCHLAWRIGMNLRGNADKANLWAHSIIHEEPSHGMVQYQAGHRHQFNQEY